LETLVKAPANSTRGFALGIGIQALLGDPSITKNAEEAEIANHVHNAKVTTAR